MLPGILKLINQARTDVTDLVIWAEHHPGGGTEAFILEAIRGAEIDLEEALAHIKGSW